ncbi:hypothetical protein FB2170_16616 [Maribacter sp. HTCC2170]|nr:hypothetical protein FB2170_16616 [Maribacter sp. HTCC2170]
MFLFFGILSCGTVKGQIKIGDNPQNIDASSVLELESDSRALVITRINTTQMNAIAPLQGAMVYNTDAQCIYYYDGVDWINLCENSSVISNLTTDPFVNSNSTLVISPNGENNHIEVAPNSIRSEHIIDGGINGDDLQDNSIGQNKLGDDAVGQNEIAENAVDIQALDNANIDLGDFTNNAGYITNANIVSGAANNAISDNGGAFYDNTTVLNAIGINTAAIAADGDTDSNNEIQNASQVNVANNPLNYTETDVNVEGHLEGIDTALGNILGGGGADGVISNITTSGNNLAVTGINGGFNGNVNLEALVDNAVSNNGFLTAEVDDSITNELTDIDFNTTTNILSLTNSATVPGGAVDLSSLAGGIGSTEVADLITITGIGTVGNPFKIEPSATLGQFLRTNATTGIVEWDDLPTGTGGAVSSDGTTIIGDGVATDLSVPIGGITTTQILDGTIANVDILDNAVTSAKILDGEIVAADLNDMGAANNEILKWNGTAWAPATDAGGTVVTPGVGLSLNGTDFDVDDLAGEVTGPTSATVIANDAVTSAKILDGEIVAADLNDMGAANNEILKWNGTAWAPATDAGGTVVTPGVGLSLNGTDFDVDDLAGEVTGPTSATVIANDAVTSAKILDGEIVAADLNDMGAANNEILKWNGTAWAPATDAGGTVVTPGVGLSLNGTDFDVDDLAGEVTGPTSATVIANDAVTSAKILDENVTPAKIAAGANGEFLTTDASGDVIWSAVTPGTHTGTANSLFFANTDGTPTTADDNGYPDNSGGLYWDPTQRYDSGALHIGLKPTSASDYSSKVVIAESFPGSLAFSYPLELRNEIGDANNLDHSGTGILFSTEDLSPHGKGGLVYERKDNWGVGDFHFLQNSDFNDDNPSFADAVLTIKNNGDVGIGTTTPSEKLHVIGNILASGTITPDYVFQSYFNGISALNPEYKLYSLEDVENFARINNHLPGVPSASEVKDKGGILINRATEINLEKIEELFIHTIEQEKKIIDLKSENESLANELESLRKDVEEIKALLKDQ